MIMALTKYLLAIICKLQKAEGQNVTSNHRAPSTRTFFISFLLSVYYFCIWAARICFFREKNERNECYKSISLICNVLFNDYQPLLCLLYSIV